MQTLFTKRYSIIDLVWYSLTLLIAIWFAEVSGVATAVIWILFSSFVAATVSVFVDRKLKNEL
jgi:hypothetical protein